jgi:hypothetical protein
LEDGGDGDLSQVPYPMSLCHLYVVYCLNLSKIMLGIDSSEHSLKAALEIPKSFGALLYAVTVTYLKEEEAP